MMREAGDFSHKPGTTSYWTSSLESAYAHGRFLGPKEKPKPVVLALDVPTELLEGANVTCYNAPTPDWQEASDLFLLFLSFPLSVLEAIPLRAFRLTIRLSVSTLTGRH